MDQIRATKKYICASKITDIQIQFSTMRKGVCIDNNLLWRIDQEIGGVGAYCLPIDPNNNPFSHGIERELYRPLQYLKRDIINVNFSSDARHVIHYSGMHLEYVAKHVIEELKLISGFRISRITLGKARVILEKNKLLDCNTKAAFRELVSMYNKSKHCVNVDNDEERLFYPMDAYAVYFGARLIGRELLELVNQERARYTYHIYDDNLKIK